MRSEKNRPITELYEANENEWGSIREDGTWSGMIGMILNNEVDAGVNSFLVTPARASEVDFITPLVTSKASVFIRVPGILDSRWVVFISSFDLSLWIILVCVVILLSLFLYCFGSILQHFKKLNDNFVFNFYNVLLCVCGIFCAQGHWATPNEWSCRIIFWTAYFIAIIVAAAYSANFMACLAIRKVSLPFTSLEGMLRDGSYDFGVLAESGLLTIFQNSTDEIMSKIYTKLIRPKLDSLPKEYVEGFQQVCHKSRYAHMENYDTYLMYASTLPCEILTLPEASFQQHMGLIVSKTFPYRKIFKHTLEKMRQTGFLLRIYNDKWSPVTDAPELPPKRVEFDDVISLFSLGGILFCGALLILCLEKKLTFRTN